MMLWNRETGQIDPEVARSWRKYDIRLKLENEWEAIGPELEGKIHVACGDQDTFYLGGAVKLLKESLQHLGSDAEIDIIEGADHGSILARDRIDQNFRQMTDKVEEVVGKPVGGS